MVYSDGRRDYRTRSPDTRRAGVRCLCDRFAWPLLATTGVGEGLAAGRTVDAGPAPAAIRHTQLLRMTGGESDRHRPQSIACQSRLTVRSSPMSHLRSIRHGPLQVAVLPSRPTPPTTTQTETPDENHPSPVPGHRFPGRHLRQDRSGPRQPHEAVGPSWLSCSPGSSRSSPQQAPNRKPTLCRPASRCRCGCPVGWSAFSRSVDDDGHCWAGHRSSHDQPSKPCGGKS